MTATTEQDSTRPKTSFWTRFQAAKRGPISDEDVKKYTGKTKEELAEWARVTPYVGGNRPAGTLAMGDVAALGGIEVGVGYGGWGPGVPGKLKFPPQPEPNPKKLESEDDD